MMKLQAEFLIDSQTNERGQKAGNFLAQA